MLNFPVTKAGLYRNSAAVCSLKSCRGSNGINIHCFISPIRKLRVSGIEIIRRVLGICPKTSKFSG